MDGDYHMDEDPPLSFVRTTTESVSRKLAMEVDVEEHIHTGSMFGKITHLVFEEEEESDSESSKSADPIIPRKPSCDLSSRATSVCSSAAVAAELLSEQREQSDSESSKSAHPRAPSVSSLISQDDPPPSRPPKRCRVQSESQSNILNNRLSGTRHLYPFGVPLPPILRDMDAYEFCLPDFVFEPAPAKPKIRLCDQTSIQEPEQERAETIGSHPLPDNDNSVATSKSNPIIRTKTGVWERPIEAFGVALPDMLLHDYKTPPVDFELPSAFVAIAKAAALSKSIAQTTPIPRPAVASYYRSDPTFRAYMPATLQQSPHPQAQSQPQRPYNGLVWLYPDGQRWTSWYAEGAVVPMNARALSGVVPVPVPASSVSAPQPPRPAPIPHSAPVQPSPSIPISISISTFTSPSAPRRSAPPPAHVSAKSRTAIASKPPAPRPARASAKPTTAFGVPLPAFLLDPPPSSSSTSGSASHEHENEFHIPDFLLTIATLRNTRGGYGYGRRTEAFGVPLPEVLLKFQETPSEFVLPEEFGVRES
ncbi:hypothetical protein MSAN_00770700 [Mycena sanguinolenta]|uniref:Uncharacterized protein n=1 Tax=Mycena sanguinolenta TaxID=230812 RepID=A0A8H6Z7Q2_9AGAR|nr:hypothetical protein MSAN_00770700 [Mycena sanguinolenta]